MSRHKNLSKGERRLENKDAVTSTPEYYSIPWKIEAISSPGAIAVPLVTSEQLSVTHGLRKAPVRYISDPNRVLEPSIINPGHISANDVADYFLSKNDETAGDLISNLKLQKLLYYAQGFCLALTDKRLFAEPLEAWTHGPVVPRVYRRFKEYGETALPSAGQRPRFDKETSALLDEVYQVYGQFSAWKLREMTHQETPWKCTETGQTISHSALKSYFKTLLA